MIMNKFTIRPGFELDFNEIVKIESAIYFITVYFKDNQFIKISATNQLLSNLQEAWENFKKYPKENGWYVATNTLGNEYLIYVENLEVKYGHNLARTFENGFSIFKCFWQNYSPIDPNSPEFRKLLDQ